jgi:hypothetical protein
MNALYYFASSCLVRLNCNSQSIKYLIYAARKVAILLYALFFVFMCILYICVMPLFPLVNQRALQGSD